MKKLIAVLLSWLLPVAAFGAVQIVVLAVNDVGDNNLDYSFLCWLSQASNPLPKPGFASSWKALAPSAGPTAAQITALQNGTVVEKQFDLKFSTATPLATVESALISYCNGSQNYLNGIPGAGIYYGQTWTGSSWVLQ